MTGCRVSARCSTVATAPPCASASAFPAASSSPRSGARAREFVCWLGEQYAARAETTMKALDEIADVDLRFVRNGELLRQQREERRTARLGAWA